MFGKIVFLLLVALCAGVQSRYLIVSEPVYYIEHYEEPELLASSRVRRDAHGALTLNSDGTSGAVVKVPFAGNDKNIVSAIGSVDLTDRQKLGAATAGVALDNINGHGLSLTDTHIPGFGDKMTAAGKVNVFHNDNHDITAKAFATRNMPDIANVPNFNTVGGGIDYMFKDKIGASASAAHTDFINRNDYSLDGKLNLFKTPDTSIDFNAGFKKFDTPFMKSSWEPNFGFSLSKYF
uniref:Attacin-E n=1 Tax=Hyalophora cecropia TaxID=7123 RepID=ATTE_HYACE|nr:RecName: Full=Attacin-E; AltName: Full=Immune protein P5; Contains: RecName: Full=Attacin-F; Flags: Precursor [Hyalophora cecropia]CAA40886.1 acidic attacin [Hyalophora cecropia]